MRVFVICCACFGIFIAGAISGGLVVARLIHPAMHASAAQQFSRQQLKRLSEQLNLSPEQHDRIQKIVVTSAREVQERRREMLSILDRMDDEIRAQLNPEQQGQYDQIRARQREIERQNQRWLREQRARRLNMPVQGAGEETPSPSPEPARRNDQ